MERDRVNQYLPELNKEEGIHDAPPKTPEVEKPSDPYIPDQRGGNPLETRDELLPEKQPRWLDRWGKYAVGFAAVTAVAAGGLGYAFWPKNSPAEKIPSPEESPKPTATSSAFPSSRAEITPTTTSVTIETKTPPKETFPMTAEGIAEILRLDPGVSGADMPKRLVGDFNKLLASIDDYEGELDKWNSKTAIDPVKGQVYGIDALITTYRQAIQDAYGGKNFYSDFVAKKVADAAGQVGKWESDGLSDVQKEAILLPTTIKVIGDEPDGKLVQFSMQFRTKGIDPTVYPDEEANFTVGYNNIKNGPVGFVSQIEPKIVSIPS